MEQQFQSVTRKAFVSDVITSGNGGPNLRRLNHIAPRYPDFDTGHPIPQPILGGAIWQNGVLGGPVQFAGIRHAPLVGSMGAVLHEVGNHPLAWVSAIDRAMMDVLPIQQPGETTIYHADGRILSQPLNSGVSNLYRDGAGSTKIYVDASGVITLTCGATTVQVKSDGLYVNTVKVVVP